MLRRGGLLFLRVNASGTDVRRAHDVLEESAAGFTALYRKGPKRGLYVRFFSRDGLAPLICRNGMRVERGPDLVLSWRPEGGGSWLQWELTARRL